MKSITVAAVGALLALGCAAAPVQAQPGAKHAEAEQLASSIEAALQQANANGCVGARADVEAIHNAIGNSVDAGIAAEALRIVQERGGLACRQERLALAGVENEVLAIVVGAPGAPGGALPIGSSPIWVGGGGSNYLVGHS